MLNCSSLKIEKNGGFTALELLVVVIITSIIALTSIPKLISLKGDDYLLSMKRTQSAVEGALQLVYEKAESDKINNGRHKLKINDLTLILDHGYPVATDVKSLKSIVYWEDAEVDYHSFPEMYKIVIFPVKVKQVNTEVPENFHCALVYENSKTVPGKVTFVNKQYCKGTLL